MILHRAIICSAFLVAITACAGGGGAGSTVPTTVATAAPMPASQSQSVTVGSSAISASLPNVQTAVGVVSATADLPAAMSGTSQASITLQAANTSGVDPAATMRRVPTSINVGGNGKVNPIVFLVLWVQNDITFPTFPGLTFTIPSSIIAPNGYWLAMLDTSAPQPQTWNVVAGPSSFAFGVVSFPPQGGTFAMKANIKYHFVLFAPGGTLPAPVPSPTGSPAAQPSTQPTVGPRGAPNWTTIEAPAPWDYTSTGPDQTACAAGEGVTYKVGPGQPYANPHNVPWLALLPCDTVLISYQTQPYSDRLYIASRGSKGKAIRISGVLGPNGERPIFDGSHAIMYAGQGYNPYVQPYGMIIIANPNTTEVPTLAYGHKPGYIVIENLEVRDAYGDGPTGPTHGYGYTDPSGTFNAWPQFTAGIYINPGEHITLRNNYLHDNGLGAFVNSLDNEQGQSRDLYVVDNHFANNSNTGAGLHNFYPEVIGERVIHNHFDPPIANTQGENIKDRSVCVEYSDNYIAGGNNNIAFRDPQSNGAFEAQAVDAFGEKCNGNLFVHGTTFVLTGPQEDGASSNLIGYGDGTGDGPSGIPNNRFGNVWFYSNVVVTVGDMNPYAMRSAPIFQNTNSPTVQFTALNDLFYSKPQSAAGSALPFARCYVQGTVTFTNSAMIGSLVGSYESTPDGILGVGTPCDLTNLGTISLIPGTDPGFLNNAGGDYHTTGASPFASLNAPLPSAITMRGLAPDGKPYP